MDNQNSALAQVNRFYIPDLDQLNAGRNLRGQLTCFGFHRSRKISYSKVYIGIHANVDSGLHVLHFQLEGSEEEALDAYSGGLICKMPTALKRVKFPILK